ncbi:MAG: hypothetical protein AB8F94_18150 [Saprospiraceae bacterium]
MTDLSKFLNYSKSVAKSYLTIVAVKEWEISLKRF